MLIVFDFPFCFIVAIYIYMCVCVSKDYLSQHMISSLPHHLDMYVFIYVLFLCAICSSISSVK